MFNWFNTVNCRIYLCQAMTGLKQYEIYKNNLRATKILEKHGITVLSPVVEEHIQPANKKLNQTSQKQLDGYWKRDKWLISHSHILLDIAGLVVSQGVIHELGFSRYFLFKPCVRVLKITGPSVAVSEEDALVDSVEEAAKLIVKRWGTPWRRLVWKVKLFCRCFFPYLKTRIFWCFDWI